MRKTNPKGRILWERTEADLLRSSLPELRAKGMAMVPYFVWNHNLHLLIAEDCNLPDMLECDPDCEPPDRTPKSKGLIAKIKSRLQIEEVAGRLTNLHGSTKLKGKCPLHNERNGEAFVVWVETQTWRCFGQCVTGGDVLDFIKECKDRGIEWRQRK